MYESFYLFHFLLYVCLDAYCMFSRPLCLDIMPFCIILMRYCKEERKPEYFWQIILFFQPFYASKK